MHLQVAVVDLGQPPPPPPASCFKLRPEGLEKSVPESIPSPHPPPPLTPDTPFPSF